MLTKSSPTNLWALLPMMSKPTSCHWKPVTHDNSTSSTIKPGHQTFIATTQLIVELIVKLEVNINIVIFPLF